MVSPSIRMSVLFYVMMGLLYSMLREKTISTKLDWDNSHIKRCYAYCLSWKITCYGIKNLAMQVGG